MALIGKIDSKGHEVFIRVKPVYKTPKQTEEDKLIDLRIRRFMLLSEIDSIDEQIKKLDNNNKNK